MKRKFHHPETPETGRTYWRSLGELEDSDEFRGWLEREFPQGAAELKADDVSRRGPFYGALFYQSLTRT